MARTNIDGKHVRYDDEDATIVFGSTWHLLRTGTKGSPYLISHPGRLLHREIAIAAGMAENGGTSWQVDHINHDTTDNRRSNLRVVTRSQNMMNRHKLGHSKWQYKGVEQRSSGHWRARIYIDHVRITVGEIETQEEAAYIYDQLAMQLFGSNALTNFVY